VRDEKQAKCQAQQERRPWRGTLVDHPYAPKAEDYRIGRSEIIRA
jgi:hypothetical protein